MRFYFTGTVIACGIVVAFVFPAFADTLWIYGGGQSLYSTVQISDTSNIKPPFTNDEPDTAYSFDTTIGYYFDHVYQFTHGWDGFKLTWEHRGFAWDARAYNTLLIKHKSSLPYHKADIFFGQCDDPYDSALVDSIGTIAADSAWTTTAIPIPLPGNSFDSAEFLSDAAERQNVREIRFLIHNAPPRTDSTSPVGNFCLDEIGLTRMAVLSSPANNAHQMPVQLTLSWSSAPGATSYGVQVSEATNFSSTVSSQSGLTATSATVSGLADNETYYWRVNVTDSTSTNAWSTAWEFSTVTSSTSKKCGCGSGTGLALLPPLWLKAMSYRKRRKKCNSAK